MGGIREQQREKSPLTHIEPISGKDFHMKTALICFAALLGIGLAGCGTLREEQNPQPKTHAPCPQWIELSGKPVQTPAEASPKADTKSAPRRKAAK